MKVRNGFVSNSSSSSFLIYGAAILSQDFEKLLEANGIDDYYDFEKKTGLCVEQPTDQDTVYIGLSWEATGSDETRTQFQDRVAGLILAGLNEKFDLSTYQDAWYNG